MLKQDVNGQLKLIPEFLGGLRRACLACSYACFDNADHSSIHPGPLWPTESAAAHMHLEDLEPLQRKIIEQEPTFATLTSDATITFDYDSDNEVDENEDMDYDSRCVQKHKLYDRILCKLLAD